MTTIDREMNAVVDHQLQRHQEPTEWDRVRETILNRFANEEDWYEIIIRGVGKVSNEPPSELRFEVEMRFTLGQLRGMK